MKRLALLSTVAALAMTPALAQQIPGAGQAMPANPMTSNTSPNSPQDRSGPTNTTDPQRNPTGDANDTRGSTGADATGAAAQRPQTAGAPGQTAQNQQQMLQQLSQVRNADEFVRHAAMSDKFETQSSEIAQRKAQSQDVKTFAQRMVDDHRKTSQQITELAQAANVQMKPDQVQLDAMHQQKIDQLNKAEGRAFDQAYVQQHVDAHRAAVTLFNAYADNGDNEQLKTFARDTLPNLQQHLQDAERIQQTLGEARNTPADRTQGRSGASATGQTEPGAGTGTAPAPSGGALKDDARGTLRDQNASATPGARAGVDDEVSPGVSNTPRRAETGSSYPSGSSVEGSGQSPAATGTSGSVTSNSPAGSTSGASGGR